MQIKNLNIKSVAKLREYKCKDGTKNLSITDKDGATYRILDAKLSGLKVSKNLKTVTMSIDCEAAFKQTK